MAEEEKFKRQEDKTVTPQATGKEKDGASKCRKKHDNHRSKFNDVSWYVIDPQILKDFGSLAFSNMLGLPVKLNNTNIVQTITQLMTVDYTAGIGKSTDPTSGYNLAIRNLYTVVRHKNSGHTNYESPDLGFYLFATTDIVCQLLECERVMSLVNSYLIKNRSVPTRLVSMLGFDADEIIANSANLRGYLNILTSRVSSLCIPKDYKFFKRRIWMASNLFKDHKSTKAIAIAFKSTGFWQYDATALSTGGALKYHRWNDIANYRSMTARLNRISAALDKITEDEDMNIMSGDILKCFGQENCQQYSFLAEGTQIFPVYVEEMLPQIQNLVSLPSINGEGTTVYSGFNSLHSTDASAIMSGPALWITQQDGYAVFAPYAASRRITKTNGDNSKRILPLAGTLSGTLPTVTSKLFLNSYNEAPTPEEVMLATRLRCHFTCQGWNDGTDAGNIITLDSFGSEIVESFTLGYISDTGYSTYSYRSVGIIDNSQDSSISTLHNLIGMGEQLVQIDWAPITYCFILSNVGTSYRKSYAFGDLDNYTLLDYDILDRLHESAVQAEFTTPVIAEFKPR